MYAALWRALPGPVWVRILILVAAASVIVAACLLWVFPWIDVTFFVPDSVVGGST